MTGPGATARELALQLFTQGLRCQSQGFDEQAEAVLSQAWSIAGAHDADLASEIAWELACLLLRRGAFAEAAEWMRRVSAPPARPSPLWPANRQALAELLGRVEPSGEPRGLPSLSVQSLGQFRIRRRGVALPPCRMRKAIGLFRYLLTVKHRAVHKEELMELFWPAAQPREARHSLHVAVGALRAYLDEPEQGPETSCLRFIGGQYALSDDPPIEEDSSAFEQQVAEGERLHAIGASAAARRTLGAAVQSYQGDYVLDGQDAAWAYAERDRLAARYLGALELLGQLCDAAGDAAATVDYYQLLLARDSYREDVVCALIRCYWRLGRRASAFQQYELCVATLERDLGLKPMPETRQLYERLCAGEPPL